MSRGPRSLALPLAAAAAVLALLAWQGHHLAQGLPRLERAMESAGPWGPVVFCAALLLLEPLLVPDTLFGVSAGVAFGLAAGTAYYFAAVYLMCLEVHWLGGHWLAGPVRRLLASRPHLQAAVANASRRGARFAFLVRLIPVNQALLSYALAAAGVPFRAVVAGNIGMFVHMLPTVYFGAAAVHVTRMAASGHREWDAAGALLMVGFGACVLLALLVSRRAWSAIGDVARGEPVAAPAA